MTGMALPGIARLRRPRRPTRDDGVVEDRLELGEYLLSGCPVSGLGEQEPPARYRTWPASCRQSIGHGERQAHIDRFGDFRPVKFRRRDTDDGERRPVDEHRLADDFGIGQKPALPVR